MARQSEPNENVLKVRRIVAFLGIFLIIIGQYLIFAVPVAEDKLPPSTIFFSLVGVVFFMLSFFLPVGHAQQARMERIAVPQKVLWIMTAVILSALTVFSMLLFLKYGKTIYFPVLATWFAAGACYIFAFKDQIPSLAFMKAWAKDHRTELLILGGITLLAAILRLYHLGVYPRVIDGDEGLLGQFALSTTSGDYANPFALWENFGALYLQAVYLAIRAFGSTAFALRNLAGDQRDTCNSCFLFVLPPNCRQKSCYTQFLLAGSLQRSYQFQPDWRGWLYPQHLDGSP